MMPAALCSPLFELSQRLYRVAPSLTRAPCQLQDLMRRARAYMQRILRPIRLHDSLLQVILIAPEAALQLHKAA